MNNLPEADPDWAAIETFLRSRGAETEPHPGGTLLTHLLRVRGRLAEWRAPREVQVAGLCHAVYGTDGFPRILLAPDRRDELKALIGEQAEGIVYLYGSCERRTTYPLFQPGGQPVFHDRLTGAEQAARPDQACAFAEITAANELDIVAHDPEGARGYGASLARLLDRMSGLLSPDAVRACTAELAAFR